MSVLPDTEVAAEGGEPRYGSFRKGPFIAIPGSGRSTIRAVRGAKAQLIRTLSDAGTPEGWADPTGESAQHLWTAIEVLESLIKSDERPRNVQSVIERIAANRKEIDGFAGWEYEGIPGHISLFVTGDVIKLYMSLGMSDAVRDLLQTVQDMQNDDGGWGVCKDDTSSKVRATSWAVSMLLKCLEEPATSADVNLLRVTRGVNWLYSAQNDRDQDYGWGNLAGTTPSNVSATAFALDALVRSMRLVQSNKTITLPTRPDSISRGMKWFIDANANGYWKGVKEEFGIKIGDRIVGRHIFGGASTTLAVQVLTAACDVGLLTPQDAVVHAGAKNLADRCKAYVGAPGTWIVPGEDGGIPLAWNSAYALDAFNAYEAFYLQHIAGNWLEREVYTALVEKSRPWERGAVVVLVALLGYKVLPNLGVLGDISTWFARLPVLVQGLVMIVVGIVIERLYSGLIRSVVMPIVAATRKRAHI